MSCGVSAAGEDETAALDGAGCSIVTAAKPDARTARRLTQSRLSKIGTLSLKMEYLTISTG
jgi:hypothetical protein